MWASAVIAGDVFSGKQLNVTHGVNADTQEEERFMPHCKILKLLPSPQQSEKQTQIKKKRTGIITKFLCTNLCNLPIKHKLT